jgi:hypothetical protein
MVFRNVQEAVRLDDQPDGSAEAGGLDFVGAARWLRKPCRWRRPQVIQTSVAEPATARLGPISSKDVANGMVPEWQRRQKAIFDRIIRQSRRRSPAGSCIGR